MIDDEDRNCLIHRSLNSLPVKRWRLVFWNSNHLEVASDSFCFLLYSSWLLVFILYVFNLFFLSLNLFCWKGFHFSQNNFLIFILIIAYLFFSLHFWIRDLTREFNKKYEVLLIYLFLLFLIFLVSEGLLFVSFFWTSFHSLSSLTLGISLGEGFYLPDPLFSFIFSLFLFSFEILFQLYISFFFILINFSFLISLSL